MFHCGIFTGMRLGCLNWKHCLNVMLDRIINKFILGLRLHHTGSLRSYHLYGTLNIDFGIRTMSNDLINYQVDDYKSARPSNTSRTMNAYRSLKCLELIKKIVTRMKKTLKFLPASHRSSIFHFA